MWGIPRVMSALSRGRYINPDKSDNCGQTPLLQAAESGHDGVVKLLLGR